MRRLGLWTSQRDWKKFLTAFGDAGNMLVDTLFVVAESGYIVSLLFNGLLLHVYFRLPLKYNSSRYFIPVTAFHNMMFACCGIAAVTRTFATNFCWTMVTSGPITSKPYSLALLALFFLCFDCSMMTITNSFVYKYIQICWYGYFHLYRSKQGQMALILINSTILIIWGAYVYIGLWPNEQLIAQMQTPLLSIIGIDLRTNGAVGICLQPQLAWPNLFVMIISVIITFALTLAGIFCALQIRRKLKRASLSAQTKKMQHRMNNLLMIQTCCPVVFLQLPAVAQYVMMYSGATTDSKFSDSSTILWMFYPISGPLVTLIFMKEYRDYYLSKLCSFMSQHRTLQTSGLGYGKNMISTTDSNRQLFRTAHA